LGDKSVRGRAGALPAPSNKMDEKGYDAMNEPIRDPQSSEARAPAGDTRLLERPSTKDDLQSQPLPAGPGGHTGYGRRPLAIRGRDLTEGSIPRNLWALAWPQIVAGSLQTVNQVLDLFWAGRGFGARAIAGIGVAQTWTQLAMTARMGLDTATRAMVSRAVGARNIPLANHVALQSFTLSGSVSLLLMLLGVLFTNPLLRLLGVSPAVIAQGAAYMRWQFVASATMAFTFMGSAVLQASGDTVTPMKAQVTTRVLYMLLSPLLAFGWLKFPRLGLMGLAVSNAFSQSIGIVWIFWVLFTGRSRLHLTLRGYRVDWPLLWQIVRLGVPSSVTGMERALAQLVLVGLASGFGDMTLAAYSVSNRIQMVANMGVMGMGQASGIMVGQNLGAGKPQRARAAIAWAIGYVMLLNAVLVGLIMAFPRPFLSLFSRDQELLPVAVHWLRIQGIGFFFMGAGMVFMQSFNTAGDTFIPMIVSLASIWGIQQPVAIMLSGTAEGWRLFGASVHLPTVLDLGEYGIAWGIVAGMAARLLVYFPYYLWGPWWKKRVFGRGEVAAVGSPPPSPA
jgi:putative MATE family efflux protein